MTDPDLIDTTDVIKNPNRSLNTQEPSAETYIPEYVRLGKHPILQDFSSIDGELVETNSDNDFPKDDNTQSTSETPQIGEFILMVGGKIILSGNKELILSQTKSILYGSHADFLDQQINPENVVILKRIGLKVGVFLNE